MKVSRLLFCVMSVMVVTLAAQAITFKYSKIKINGATSGIAYGINNQGAIVGFYGTAKGTGHGFLLQNGTVENIEYPHANKNSTICFGINNNGAIVGGYGTGSGDNKTTYGFLYQNGSYTQINPGAEEDSAQGINDSGQIVGWAIPQTGPIYGFFTGDPGVQYEAPGSVGTLGYGVNNSADMVFLGPNEEGGDPSWLYSNGQWTNISPAACTTSIPYGINNEQEVVFLCGDSSGTHGGLLSNGKFYELNFPKAVLTVATGINDNHQIVGFYYATSLDGPAEPFEATY
jgi:probable HAF family extracellular repeat protein